MCDRRDGEDLSHFQCILKEGGGCNWTGLEILRVQVGGLL